MLLVKQLMFFVSIGTIWLSNAEGRGTHRTHCNTTVNIHTRCGDGIISQEMTAERFMIYCVALQFVLRVPFTTSTLSNAFHRFCNSPPQKNPSSIIIIIITSLQSACKFDLYLQMSCLAAPSRLWQFSDKSQSAVETYFCSPFITIILRFTI